MELTVILPTHNGAATVARQLEALARQVTERQWELVVVDNGSTDDTARIVDEWLPSFSAARRIAAHERLGLPYARNVGVNNARGAAVAFCDDDDVVEAGWVEAMARALRDHQLVGSRLCYEQLNDPSEHVTRAGFQTERIEHMWGLPTLTGAGFGCRRELWGRLGGNDESFDRTGEDFEFSMRAYVREGVWPAFVADACYQYRRRSGALATFRQARRYGRSHVALFEKFGRSQGIVPEQPIAALRRWVGLLARCWYLLDNNRRVTWAWRTGIRLGRLEGSLKQRTWYP